MVVGCGREEPRPIEHVLASGTPTTDDRYDGRIAFPDGVVIDRVEVSPPLLEPGAPFTLRFVASGPAADLRIGLEPPLSASRQVARGGVDAPPPVLPPDPRSVFTTVAAASGERTLTLQLPEPWHPPTAVLTLERTLPSGARLHANTGPRRHDGVAFLALVDVASRPTAVHAIRLPAPVRIDGILDEPIWQHARAHELVGTLDGDPRPDVPGSVRFAWDDAALHVAATFSDTDLRSRFTAHDDPLWEEEAFELFVFGDAERSHYLELQVSPRGVTFDARFERYRNGDHAWNGRWQSAVSRDGTLDDARDRDRGWSLELAVPWAEICEHTEVVCPPAAGMKLRVNAFRLERPRRAQTIALSLSPPKVPDFHAPENAAVLELLP